MKVMIVNAYNRHNAGDAALLSVLVSQVHEAFPGSTVLYAGLEDPGQFPAFEGARNVGSVRRWVGDESLPRHRRIGRKAAALGLVLLPAPMLRWLAGYGRSTRPAPEPLVEVRGIADADLVLGLGGGYLNGTDSLAGTLNVAFLLLPLAMATRLHRPTVLAPQSYGPFARPVQGHMVRSVLNAVDRVVVREDISIGHLRSVGVRPHLLVRGVDSAFALSDTTDAPTTPTDGAGHPRVALTARAWLPGAEQSNYERSLAGFVDWLHATRGAEVILVPQVTSDYQGDDDRLVSRRVASSCRCAPLVMEAQLDHRELRSVYRSADYVVGTRFHSVIFSLTAGTPALAIEYEHKTSGIMSDLGLAEWVIPIRAVTTNLLCTRFAALEAAAADYERQIKEKLPDYTGRAQDFVEILRRSMD
jgi:colanic acid/amylovoran biosynthesis protein